MENKLNEMKKHIYMNIYREKNLQGILDCAYRGLRSEFCYMASTRY